MARFKQVSKKEGEGYEQRPRKTDYGELYVSFWQYDGFSIRTKEEMESAQRPARSRPQVRISDFVNRSPQPHQYLGQLGWMG